MSTPVTAVIPTKNRVELLRTTLRSVLAQRDVDLHVVVVDDGSGPRDAEEIAAHAGGPVRVLRNTASRGVAAARNQGVEAARTPWVAFCDDDDLWTPGKLIGQVAAADRADRAWAYTGAVKFALGPVVWQVMPPPSIEEVVERLPTRNVIPAGASNIVVDRGLVLDSGGFDERLMHLADWDMWLRLLEHGEPACSHGIGVAYRLHPHTMSLEPRGLLHELEVIDHRWRDMRGGARLDPGPTHLWIAMSHMRAGQRREAALSYARAARTRPRQGIRGALRSLYPAAPRPAHIVGPHGRRTRALKKVHPVELTAEATCLLESLAAAPTGSGRA